MERFNDSNWVYQPMTKEYSDELKLKIVNYLSDKELYDESDDLLIEELLFNIEMAHTAKYDIKENGIKINVTRDPDKEDFFKKQIG